ASRSWYQVVESAELHDMGAAKGRGPCGLKGHSGVPGPQDIDQSRGQSRVVPSDGPLIVLQIRKPGRLAGQVLRTVVLVVLVNSSPEYRMLTARCYVVIHSRRIRIP